MKGVLCKNKKDINQKKKRVTFRDDYERRYFVGLITFVSMTILYSLYCFIKKYNHYSLII